jgi:hypothetical protein
MYELLLRTETLFLGLQTPALLGIGIGAIVVGLVFWLGGTRHSAAIIGLLGAVVGGAAGLLVSHWVNVNPWLSTAAGAAVLGGLAIVLRNVLILVLAVLVFSAVSGAGYLSVILDRAIPQAPSEAQAPSGAVGEPKRTFQYFSNLSPTDRWNYLNGISQETGTFFERLQALLANTWEAASPHGWALILAVAAGALVGILLVWLIAKIIIALAYSLVGTTLVFLGTQAALLAASVPVVSGLDARRWMLPAAFVVTTVAGWVWQVFYGGSKKPRRPAPQEAEPSD